jgi:hypothetical protein
MYMVGAAYVIWTFTSFLGFNSAATTWKLWSAFLVPGLVWMGIALGMLRSYRLYGRVPRSLAIHVRRGTLSSRREASARWWSWRLDAVRSVRVAPVKSVVSRKVGVDVVVEIRGRLLPLRFRFAARDVRVAEQFAEALRRVVYGGSAKGQA